jgi:hypothetical protein
MTFFILLRRVGLLLLTGMMLTAVIAQDMAECAALMINRLSVAAEACAETPLNSLCVGSAAVQVQLAGGELAFMPGDTLALDTVTGIATGSADVTEDAWGLALLNTDVGLAAGSLQMVLFGDATLTNAVNITTLDLPIIGITNTAGYDVNLREGPGIGFTTVGIFRQNTTLIADGRSTDGQWYRVRAGDGLAWVSASTPVQLEGTPESLMTLDNPYTTPMQVFTLATPVENDDLCGMAASGLLVALSGDERVHLMANNVDLAFSTAILLLQANIENGLQVHVIRGAVQARVNAQTIGASAGETLTIPIADETLLAAGGPELKARFAFAAVGGAPLALVDAAGLQCIIGTTQNEVTTFGGPGSAYPELSNLDAAAHYIVTGFALDETQRAWWRLDNGRWTPQDAVQAVGLCANVAQVETPPITNFTPLSAANANFLPAETTIYQANSGPDILSGTCSGSPVAVCIHPAAIIPQADGTFLWRGQEPKDYLMSPTTANTYQHIGRNFANNANIKLTMTLTSTETWQMTMETVYDNDPLCIHTFNYTAAR